MELARPPRPDLKTLNFYSTKLNGKTYIHKTFTLPLLPILPLNQIQYSLATQVQQLQSGDKIVSVNISSTKSSLTCKFCP